MVHRAIMGSLERFIGILVENFAGALPTWLAPEQARLLTVTEAGDEATLKMCEELKAMGIRATADTRNEKLGFKVREAQLAKVPYILVVGEKEVQGGRRQCAPAQWGQYGAQIRSGNRRADPDGRRRAFQTRRDAL